MPYDIFLASHGSYFISLIERSFINGTQMLCRSRWLQSLLSNIARRISPKLDPHTQQAATHMLRDAPPAQFSGRRKIISPSEALGNWSSQAVRSGAVCSGPTPWTQLGPDYYRPKSPPRTRRVIDNIGAFLKAGTNFRNLC